MFSKFIQWFIEFFSAKNKPVAIPPVQVPSNNHESTPPPSLPETKVEVTIPAPVKKDPPRGVWIWWIPDLPPNYLELLCKAGCRRVYLKVFDDANYDTFKSQSSPATIKKFNDLGIEVFGWGYHFDNRSTIDVKAQVAKLVEIAKSGIKGYIFDVEKEVENPATHSQLIDLISSFKKATPVPLTIGYTSFGAPGYHSGVPYAKLQEVCDAQFPQMYYESFNFGSNEAEVKECWDQHIKMGLNKKPIYPIWSSEPGVKNPSSISELQSFLNKYPGSSIWRLPGFKENGGLAFKLVYGDPLTYNPPVPPPTSTPASAGISSKLYSYYSNTSNYDKVYYAVKDWFAPLNGGSVTSNGCVAFMSTALRQVGVDIPKGDISMVTLPFSKYLESTLKWKKITNSNDLLPGDVVLTQDDPRYPGYPAHTYMFAGWVDKSKGIGCVVDNRDFKYSRNVFGYGDYNFTPFAYAFRSLV